MEQKFCNFLGNGLYISNRSSDLKISQCCFYKSPTIITDIHTSVKNLDDKINLLLHDSSIILHRIDNQVLLISHITTTKLLL